MIRQLVTSIYSLKLRALFACTLALGIAHSSAMVRCQDATQNRGTKLTRPAISEPGPSRLPSEAVGYSIDNYSTVSVPSYALSDQPGNDVVGRGNPVSLDSIQRRQCYATNEGQCAACTSAHCSHRCCQHDMIFKRMWHNHKIKSQAAYLGYPEYFDEPRFGLANDAASSSQIKNGIQDQCVLYDYDFLPGAKSGELSPYGIHRLRQIASESERWGTQIIINATLSNIELSVQRRENVASQLSSWGLDHRVVRVGNSNLPGISGVESVPIFANQLKQTETRGTTASTLRSSLGNR